MAASKLKRVEVNFYYYPSTPGSVSVGVKFTPFTCSSVKGMMRERRKNKVIYLQNKVSTNFYYHRLSKSYNHNNFTNIIKGLEDLLGIGKHKKLFFPYRKIMKVRQARHLYEKLMQDGFIVYNVVVANAQGISIGNNVASITINSTGNINIANQDIFTVQNDAGNNVFTIQNNGNFSLGPLSLDTVMTKDETMKLLDDRLNDFEKKLMEYFENKEKTP